MLSVTTISIPAYATANIVRGRYGELAKSGGVGGLTGAKIIKRFEPALPAPFHEFDHVGRGEALNHDLYGYDAAQELAVVQIRHVSRRTRNGFLRVHKDYALVGVNENGNWFRHPVSSSAVHGAIRKTPEDPAAAVRGAQKWMWGVTDAQLKTSLAAGKRQGDVLLVRERTPREADITVEHPPTVVVGGSHEIRAARIVEVKSGRIVAQAPSLWHSKHQHAPTYADDEGWYSVRVAAEAATWKWGTRLAD